MKQHRRGSREPRFADPAFLDALDERASGGASPSRQVERKTKQFCRQVQQALNLALAGRSGDAVIGSLFVEEVLPAPDCGRLLARVLVPEELPTADALAALSHETPRLRAEVAASITRKRAPQLCFAPLDPEGGVDE